MNVNRLAHTPLYRERKYQIKAVPSTGEALGQARRA
jgi:hypothetical protein